jgi:hypothetical protein
MLQRSLKTRELAALSDVTERIVEGTLTKGSQDPSPPGHHRAFDDDTERALVDMILDRFDRGSAMTTKELLTHVQKEKPKVTKDWVHPLIGRRLDVLQVCRSLPQEESRMTVLCAHLEKHILLMKSPVEGK